MGTRPRLEAQDVACWVLRTSRPPQALVDGWEPGADRRLLRCVRPSYRLGLMGAGQRCLLWLSGRDEPGVHAVGLLAGSPQDLPGGPAVPVDLHRLAEPVPRAELVMLPASSRAEVVRMPAGSNPSYLTAPQLHEVVERLDAGALQRAGWA